MMRIIWKKKWFSVLCEGIREHNRNLLGLRNFIQYYEFIKQNVFHWTEWRITEWLKIQFTNDMYILDHKIIFHIIVLNILETTFEVITPYFLKLNYCLYNFCISKMSEKKNNIIFRHEFIHMIFYSVHSTTFYNFYECLIWRSQYTFSTLNLSKYSFIINIDIPCLHLINWLNN